MEAMDIYDDMNPLPVEDLVTEISLAEELVNELGLTGEVDVSINLKKCYKLRFDNLTWHSDSVVIDNNWFDLIPFEYQLVPTTDHT